MWVLFIIICIIIWLMIVALVESSKREAKFDGRVEDNKIKLVSGVATVVSKRTKVVGSYGSYTYYFITFEIEKNYKRVEFEVLGEMFGIFAEGDRVILSYQGDKIIKVDRIV